MQWQIDLLMEMEACPQPYLSLSLAFREAAVQELPALPAEPTGLVVTRGIQPTTWLKFYHQQFAMTKEHLGNLGEEGGETSLTRMRWHRPRGKRGGHV